MELTPENRRICQLISREIVGTIDEDGRRELALWREQDEDNELFHRRVTDPACMRGRRAETGALDIARQLKEFERRTGRRFPAGRHRLPRYAVAAAAVVIAIIAFRVWPGHDGAETPVVAQIIEPGSHKATLVLDDGSRLDLDDSTAGIVESRDSIRIASDTGSLSYREIDTPAARELRNRIIVPTAGEYRVELSDGTTVYLNAESELEFPVQFADDRREVVLKGEACFVVSASERWPFVVKSGDVDVVVTGTEFNMRAYPDEELIRTTLLRGSVAMLSDGHRVELAPSQQAVWSRGSGEMSVKDVDPEMFLAWKNGQFVFFQDRLEDIMRDLARWYDIDVVYLDETLRDMRFAGRLDRSDDLAPILNIICATGKITAVVNGRQVAFGSNRSQL